MNVPFTIRLGDDENAMEIAGTVNEHGVATVTTLTGTGTGMRPVIPGDANLGIPLVMARKTLIAEIEGGFFGHLDD